MTIFPIMLDCGYKIVMARVITNYGTMMHIEAPDGFVFGLFHGVQSAIDFLQNSTEKSILEIRKSKTGRRK